MKESGKDYKRIVVKIGSSLFYKGKDLKIIHLYSIVSSISSLMRLYGKEVVIVSSGAIALGMDLIKLKTRPKELPFLQAVAAIGQNTLMDNYSKYFGRYKINCAQILLTWDDFADRKRYLNARNTLITLLKLGAIPIVNENDTVSTDEIKFGDNDRLSALVAGLISADLLVILSDVDGLLDKDGKIIRVVEEINPKIRKLACPTDKRTSVGGMITKIEAAEIAIDSGIPCVITDGFAKDLVLSIVRPGKSGTLFISKKGLTERERWIAFGTKPKGKIMVDDGAKNALINNKSLLSVGVIATGGDFERADIVSIMDKQNCEFARGKAGVSSKQLDEIKGRHYDKEVIHCDNIVIL